MKSNLHIRFLGHNAWFLTIDSARILIDPFLTHSPTAAISADEAEADLILISHGHGDHFGDALAIAKRTGAKIAAIAEIAGYAEKRGAETFAMNLGGGINFPFGRIQMVHALHSSTLPDGAPGGSSAGFLITLNDGRVLYFACDTGLFGDMARLAAQKIEYAFLPIGDVFTMGPDDALEAVKLIRPRVAVPCHYGTWPLIAQDPEMWKKRVEAETETKVQILQPGQVLAEA